MTSQSPNPLVSAVIIHSGKPQFLKGCLDSLLSAKGSENIEAIVVDNCSQTPDLEELIALYRNVRLVHLAKRSGYPTSTNAGIRVSTGKYLLWCNDDLVFDASAVQLLADFLESHPDYGAAAPRLLNPDGSYQPSFSLIHISLVPLILERLYLSRLFPSQVIALNSNGREMIEQDVAVGTGACLLIRREALKQIGDGIDERFFIYSEEFDLCHCLFKAGWKVRYLPSACVTHFGGQTTTKTERSRIFMVQSWRSNYAYIRKHYGDLAETVLAFFVVVTAVPRICVGLGRQIAGVITANQGCAKSGREQRQFHCYLLRLSLTAGRHQASVLPELERSPWS